jgi:hypothetical protein
MLVDPMVLNDGRVKFTGVHGRHYGAANASTPAAQAHNRPAPGRVRRVIKAFVQPSLAML